MFVFLTSIKEAAKKEKIGERLEKLKVEVKAMNNPIDVESYYAKKETTVLPPESPRAYERNSFMF